LRPRVVGADVHGTLDQRMRQVHRPAHLHQVIEAAARELPVEVRGQPAPFRVDKLAFEAGDALGEPADLLAFDLEFFAGRLDVAATEPERHYSIGPIWTGS